MIVVLPRQWSLETWLHVLLTFPQHNTMLSGSTLPTQQSQLWWLHHLLKCKILAVGFGWSLLFWTSQQCWRFKDISGCELLARFLCGHAKPGHLIVSVRIKTSHAFVGCEQRKSLNKFYVGLQLYSNIIYRSPVRRTLIHKAWIINQITNEKISQKTSLW